LLKKTGTANAAIEDLDLDSNNNRTFAMDIDSNCESVSAALMELSDLGFDSDGLMPSLGDVTDWDWDSDNKMTEG
jgi:hypothetical protein